MQRCPTARQRRSSLAIAEAVMPVLLAAADLPPGGALEVTRGAGVSELRRLEAGGEQVLDIVATAGHLHMADDDIVDPPTGVGLGAVGGK